MTMPRASNLRKTQCSLRRRTKKLTEPCSKIRSLELTTSTCYTRSTIVRITSFSRRRIRRFSRMPRTWTWRPMVSHRVHREELQALTGALEAVHFNTELTIICAVVARSTQTWLQRASVTRTYHHTTLSSPYFASANRRAPAQTAISKQRVCVHLSFRPSTNCPVCMIMLRLSSRQEPPPKIAAIAKTKTAQPFRAVLAASPPAP